MNLKIGITERGDAGIDLSWQDKLDSVDGAILITKNITEEFQKALLAHHNAGKPLILHATCTGWGNSWLEPNVPPKEKQIESILNLLDKGFPLERIVLRMDPIIPTNKGLYKFISVIQSAEHKRIPVDRIRKRISLLDEYPHVKERLEEVGEEPFYGQYFQAAPWDMQKAAFVIDSIANTWDNSAEPFEACAEPKFAEMSKYIKPIGCVSEKDIGVMGLDINDLPVSVNGQNRNGCLCCTAKTELLAQRHRCPNGCLYCYWK